MPRTEFEPAIPASERSHTYAFERTATGIGNLNNYEQQIARF